MLRHEAAEYFKQHPDAVLRDSSGTMWKYDRLRDCFLEWPYNDGDAHARLPLDGEPYSVN